MGAHRSLGEFSIENTKNDYNFEKFVLKDSLSGVEKLSSVVKTTDSDELQKCACDSMGGLGDRLYTFPDLLAIFFSYLFYQITAAYLGKVELSELYKHNGLVVLLCVSLVVNAYYLLRPFSKKHIDVLDKISLVSITSILLSGIYSIIQLVHGNIDNSAFENVFFIGSILFVFDQICFRAGIGKVEESLSLEKDYLLKDFVNIASTDNLQSATVEKKVLDKLKRNDLVHVKVGDILPFDGEVVDGEAIVSKRIYAGEAETNILTKKVYAFAGSKILNGELIVRVDNLWEDTFIYDNMSKCQSAIQEKQTIFTKKEFSYFFVAMLFFLIVNVVNSGKFSLENFLLFIISCGVAFSFFKIFIVKDSFTGLLIKRAFSDNILIGKRKFFNTLLTIKNYIFDFSNGVFSRDFCVEKFKLYDERIDESYLLEALFSIFAKSDTPILKKLNSFIAKNQKIIKAYKLQEYIEYSDCNVVASLSNTKFIIGEESFMIEMKVQAQESDFIQEKKGYKIIYVALSDMIVGCFELTEEFLPAMTKLVSKVTDSGANFYLTSKEREDIVDDIGKKVGVSIANIYGGLSIKNYIEKISTIGKSVFFSNLQTDKQITDEVEHNVGVFDPVLCETENLDAVIFGDNISSFGKVVGYIKSFRKFLFHFYVFFIISLLILIAVSFSPIYLMLAVLVLSNLFLNLFRYRGDKF